MSEKTSPFEVTEESDAFSERHSPLDTSPNEFETKTLKHVSGSIPLSCWYIAGIELAERFSYYGLSTPFQNYAQNGPNDHPKGVLDLGSHDATAITYFWQFWCFLSPLIGAYIADSHLGKYVTICWFSAIYLLGMMILLITSIPSIESTGLKLGGFIIAIIVIGLGSGGIKANISTLIADQIAIKKPRVKTLKNGIRVIEDPSITIQNVFLLFYLMINLGSLSVLATSTLELHVDFWAANLLAIAVFALVPILLILGKTQFVKIPVGDKVISKAFRCTFIALKNKFNFEAAKPSLHPEASYPWDDKFVSEVDRALHACKVFLFYPTFWLVYGQMMSNFVSQAGQMESHGIPNDMLQVANSLSIILLIPVCEAFIYPFIRRFTPFRAITRITWGFTLAALGMVFAAVLQHYIYKSGPCYQFPRECGPEYSKIPNNIHLALQIPGYVILGLSEILASVTGLEYAYTKAPASMKSFIMALFLLTIATGSALGIALAPTAKDPRMVWNYVGIAISCFATALGFYVCFRHYNDKEEEWNQLDYAESN